MAEPRPTSYRIEIACADMGEYDALFMSHAVAAVVELLGEAGVTDFMVRSDHHRPGEF